YPEESAAIGARAKWELSSNELAALRRRNDVRALNRSVEGLTKKFDDQIQAMKKEYGSFDDAPERVQAQIEATHAKLLETAATEAMAKVDREHGLRQRVAALED